MNVKEDNHASDIRSLLGYLRRAENTGVIHVGAHQGEEVEAYLDAGFERVVLIEANPRLSEYLLQRFADDVRVRVFNCAIADHDGFVDLHIHTSRTGNTEPASILPLKRFKEIVKTLHTPETLRVPCYLLDTLLELNGMSADEFSLLNVDVQGAELLVLKGARRVLDAVGSVISEVSLIELYEDCAAEQEIAEILEGCGFRKVTGIYHSLYDENSTFPAWGECLFSKERPDG